MSDKEDTTASLWNSGILSVKHSPRRMIPAFVHESQEGGEVVASSRGKKAGDILEYEPAGAKASNHPKGDEGEVSTDIVHSEALSGDAEGLARRAENEKVN
jgi:hypothetical protein